MNFGRISEQQAFDALAELNRRFHARMPGLFRVYELLERDGIDYRQCVLVDIIPDAGGSYDATLLGPNAERIVVEVCPDGPEECALHVAPKTERAQQPKGDPREPGNLARRFYRELLDC